MRRTKQVALFALALSLIIGCVDDPDGKYARPDWLAGKVFTQIDSAGIFTTFAECLRLTGYDTIINTSGSYTVFAPNDDAFDAYLQETGYGSPAGIPPDELLKLVKYHIVQNPWTKDQLRSLDYLGWIDPTDETNDEPKGFKRETLLFDKDIKYGTKIDGNKGEEDILIVDTLGASWTRRVVTDSRKYAPIFYKEYFDIYDLSLTDYEFYYGRTFEDNGDIFYHNARVIGPEIFAENGFVYNVDRVVTPAKNAYQIISAEYPDKSYSKFLDILNQFPKFEYNSQETFDQVGADQGLKVDSLFDLTFPELTFHLTRERTKAPPGAPLRGFATIRYQHGMLAPTNTALEKLESVYLPGGSFWNGIDGSPESVRRIIANTHLSQYAVYRTDIVNGFYTGEEDLVTVDENSIVHREYGSNASFLGLDDPIVPRAFSSVTGPVYLRKGFARVMQAVESSGLLAALKRERDPDERYMFFIEADVNSSADSSFLYEAADDQFFAFTIAGSASQRVNISKNDLRVMLLNHIAVREPAGLARKEFVPNLAGNYIIFDNETGEVRGNAKTSQGYNGVLPATVIPTRIDGGTADNGSTWEISDWFSFSVTSLYIMIQSKFPDFHALIVKAGLANTKLNKFSFISASENYTVFAPTKLALAAAQADTLVGADLQNFVLSHFIRREIMFTDNYSPEGYYETCRPDESSTQFNLVNTKIFIDPNLDEIDFRAGDGSSYTTIVESDSTNILAGQLITEGQATFPVMLNNAVIHKLDKALIISELDVTK